MKRKTGIILNRTDSASPQKRSTIFINNKKTQPTTEEVLDSEDELNIPMDEAVKFEKQQNKKALFEYDGSVSPTPIAIVREVASTEEEVENAKKRMDNLIEGSDATLYTVKSVFPFDLFPDKLVLDINKVNLISKEFFWSERVHSVLIEDISDVYIDTSPFFSTLHVVDENFTENMISIQHLKKDEAARARRIIQGLVIARKQTLDLTHINPAELVPRLEELGKAA